MIDWSLYLGIWTAIGLVAGFISIAIDKNSLEFEDGVKILHIVIFILNFPIIFLIWICNLLWKILNIKVSKR
jgi:hypothetical protein